MEVTNAMIEAFGQAWAEIDNLDTRPPVGARRRAGIQAVLDLVDQPTEAGACPLCGCPAPHKQLWTVEEVADHFRVSKMTVYRMCNDEPQQLKAIRIGRSFRIPQAEVVRMSGGTVALAPPPAPPGFASHSDEWIEANSDPVPGNVDDAVEAYAREHL